MSCGRPLPAGVYLARRSRGSAGECSADVRVMTPFIGGGIDLDPFAENPVVSPTR
jgi:hypothetical protein